jgi:carbamoyl-phosphate synthase small subunit
MSGYFKRRIGYLVLEDGSQFKGRFFGVEKEVAGEVVFNTSMCGYQEILTDPSYHNQLVTMTYPEMGNYGIMDGEGESSKIQVKAFLVRHYVETYSNQHAAKSLEQYLIENEIPGLTGIDTRKLTLRIRDQGAMRGGIFFKPEKAQQYLINEVPTMSGQNLADVVTVKEKYSFGQAGQGIKIAVIDFGIKQSILRFLAEEGFYGTVYPSTVEADVIINQGYEAVFFSNGPGDPEPVQGGQKLARRIMEKKIPAFGICLGHQILGIAMGARSYKLKFGHRGGNQPVLDSRTRKVEITAQNHGFALDMDSFKNIADVEITHYNLNDQTVEGLRHRQIPVMSVQYHPESAPGPHDARYLFREFKEMVLKNRK